MNQARRILESYFKITGSLPFPKLRIRNIPKALFDAFESDHNLSGHVKGYDVSGDSIILVFDEPVKAHDIALCLDLSLAEVQVYTANQQGHTEPQFAKFSVVYLDNEEIKYQED